MISSLLSWLEKNPPDKMPFWKGAQTSTPFGLRTSQYIIEAGCSPGHLGVDRAGGNLKQITMPFPGRVEYTAVGGVAGSLTRIIPDGLLMEIQIFHALKVGALKNHYTTGEMLPIQPHNLGKSYGIHTHTEVLMPYDPGVESWFQSHSLRIGDEYVLAHCSKHNIDPFIVEKSLARQVKDWGILELWTHYAVRTGVPDYRRPHWGAGHTIHADSLFLLRI